RPAHVDHPRATRARRLRGFHGACSARGAVRAQSWRRDSLDGHGPANLEQPRGARDDAGENVGIGTTRNGTRVVMEKRFKFRHVNELTGLFVIAVVALVIAGLVFSGHSQRWFARKFAFDVLLPEAGTSGLRRGDEVFILGVSAGLVDDIVVGDDGRMKAHVKIRRDFERFVRVDSRASINKAFAVAGDSFMEIERGTKAPLPIRSPTITCLPSEDSLGRMEKMLASLSAELIPVVKKAGAGLDEWTKLGADLQKTR